MKEKLVVFRPYNRNENPYIYLVRKCIEDNGYKVITPKMAFLPRNIFKKIYATELNWYENVECDRLYKTYVMIIKRKLLLLYLKHIRKSKIVITVHNKKSHKASNKDLSVKMLAWLLNRADAIVILCDITRNYVNDLMEKEKCSRKNSKIFKIEITSYENVYPHSSEEVFYQYSDNQREGYFELAYFGTISEYKNVEIIERLAEKIENKKIWITVVGKCNEEYSSRLNELFAKRKNITYRSEFVPEDKIWGFIKGADCIVLPYHKETVLNSAAVILALTVGTNVICPECGTTKEFPKGMIYSYDYNDDNDHLEALYSKVNEAYSDYLYNRSMFDYKITQLKTIVRHDYSYEKTKQKYKELFEGLEF